TTAGPPRAAKYCPLVSSYRDDGTASRPCVGSPRSTKTGPTGCRPDELGGGSVIGADYPFLDVLWTIIIIFAWVIWFWLLITVFADLFRRRDISGWAKAAWIIFVIILPYLGVLIYLIAQHDGMAER